MKRLLSRMGESGRITQASTGSVTKTYQYDALGRMVSTSDGSTTNWLVYQGAHVSAETDGAGTVLRSYTHGPGIDWVLAMNSYIGGVTNTYVYLTDHLGTVHAIVDAATGNIVESYTYDAWGNVSTFDGSGNPISASQIGNSYLFQGRRYDWDTGLYYFRARWYDPVTGRWLSKDPIGISGGLNQYVFCGNNPVNFVDPFGLERWQPTKPLGYTSTGAPVYSGRDFLAWYVDYFERSAFPRPWRVLTSFLTDVDIKHDFNLKDAMFYYDGECVTPSDMGNIAAGYTLTGSFGPAIACVALCFVELDQSDQLVKSQYHIQT